MPSATTRLMQAIALLNDQIFRCTVCSDSNHSLVLPPLPCGTGVFCLVLWASNCHALKAKRVTVFATPPPITSRLFAGYPLVFFQLFHGFILVLSWFYSGYSLVFTQIIRSFDLVYLRFYFGFYLILL